MAMYAAHDDDANLTDSLMFYTYHERERRKEDREQEMTINATYRPAGPFPYLIPSQPASPPHLAQSGSGSGSGPGLGEGSSSSSSWSSPFGLGTVHQTKTCESKRRPKISLNTSHTSVSEAASENDLASPEFPIPKPHHFTDPDRDGDYSSYSALSPLHAKDSPSLTTIYNRHLPAAARSFEILPSPLRTRPPIPISTSYTHLPYTEAGPEIDTDGDGATNQRTDWIGQDGTMNVMGGQSQPGKRRSVERERERPGIKREPTPSTMSITTIPSSLSDRYGPWKQAERARLQSIQKQRMSNGTANFYFPPEEQPWDPKAVKRLSTIGTK